MPTQFKAIAAAILTHDDVTNAVASVSIDFHHAIDVVTVHIGINTVAIHVLDTPSQIDGIGTVSLKAHFHLAIAIDYHPAVR